MPRNLKALGLALAAALAISALVAASAQANFTTFRTNSPTGSAFLTAEADPTSGGSHVFESEEGNGLPEKCNKVGLLNKTVPNTITDKATELTLQPSYSECTTPFGAATINTEHCHDTFHSATEGTAPNNMSKVDIKCEAGQAIVWSSAGCEIKIGEQSGLGGVRFTNSGTTPEHITMQATIKGITSTANFTCNLAGIFGSNKGTTTGNQTIKCDEDLEGKNTGKEVGCWTETLVTSEMP